MNFTKMISKEFSDNPELERCTLIWGAIFLAILGLSFYKKIPLLDRIISRLPEEELDRLGITELHR